MPAFDDMWIAPGATCDVLGDEAFVTTSIDRWSQAVQLPVPVSRRGIDRAALVPLSCSSGNVGVAVYAGGELVSGEEFLGL